MFSNNQRWRNYGLWVAIVALIPMFAEALADYNIFVTLPSNYQKLAFAILGVLVLLGVVNDPNTTDSKGYLDDKE